MHVRRVWCNTADCDWLHIVHQIHVKITCEGNAFLLYAYAIYVGFLGEHITLSHIKDLCHICIISNTHFLNISVLSWMPSKSYIRMNFGKYADYWKDNNRLICLKVCLKFLNDASWHQWSTSFRVKKKKKKIKSQTYYYTDRFQQSITNFHSNRTKKKRYARCNDAAIMLRTSRKL